MRGVVAWKRPRGGVQEPLSPGRAPPSPSRVVDRRPAKGPTEQSSKAAIGVDSGGELVAETRNRDDERRLLGVFFELLAQAGDVNIHGAGKRFRTVRPHFLQQDVTRQGCSR